ncbi:hypothetical protein ACJJTC_019113 [Scirpophaga incertulas]
MMVYEADERPVIPQFYEGKDIFITGVTGFLGKVVVERLLSTCPGVGRIYVLMRGKRGVDPDARLLHIKKSPAFDILRKKAPEQLDKLCIVVGDIAEPMFGLNNETIEQLKDVRVVLHCAATVKLDGPLANALTVNTAPVERLLALTDRMPHLEVAVHVSTLFCQAERPRVEERVYPASRPLADVLHDSKELSPEDTMKYIWPKVNTYTFAKDLAESLVAQRGENAPYATAIFRPAIIVSSSRHPFPGWVENFNGPSGVVAGTMSGVLCTLECDEAELADLMPVDITADALLAATWETATNRVPRTRVYNCGGGRRRSWRTLREHIEDGCRANPAPTALRYPRLILIPHRWQYLLLAFFYQTIPLYLLEFISRIFIRTKKRLDYIIVNRKLYQMNQALRYFSTHRFTFLDDNVRALWVRLSKADKDLYNLDIDNIDWDENHRNFILGVRRHVMKLSDDTIPAARKHLERVYYIQTVVSVILPLGLLWLLLKTGALFGAFALLSHSVTSVTHCLVDAVAETK